MLIAVVFKSRKDAFVDSHLFIRNPWGLSLIDADRRKSRNSITEKRFDVSGSIISICKPCLHVWVTNVLHLLACDMLCTCESAEILCIAGGCFFAFIFFCTTFHVNESLISEVIDVREAKIVQGCIFYIELSLSSMFTVWGT